MDAVLTTGERRSWDGESERAMLESGRVLAVVDGSFRIEGRAGIVVARRAASCLIAPIVGDRVAMIALGSGERFVTAVLVRDGDVLIEVSKGRLTVAARDGIDLVSSGEVSILSTVFSVRAATGKILLDELSLLGSQLVAHVDRIKSVASAVDSVFDRVSSRIKRSYRKIEEMDLVRAHLMDYRAESMMNLRGKNALLTAEELVRVDAEQVHLG